MTRWKPDISEDWVDEGFLALANAKIDETEYQNRIIKKRIFDSIAYAYWHGAVRCADTLQPPICGPGVLTEEALLRRLGMDSGTISRWLNGITPPQADKALGSVVIVLRKEVEQVGFPPIRDIAWTAVSRTMEIIRREDCALDSRIITKEEYCCVWLLTRHPLSKQYLNREYQNVEEKVFGDIYNELIREFSIGNAKFIPKAIDNWLEPYLLFRVGLLPGWECLDERSNVST